MSEASSIVQFTLCISAFRGSHHEDQRAENHCADLQFWEDGLYGSQEVCLLLINY